MDVNMNDSCEVKAKTATINLGAHSYMICATKIEVGKTDYQ